MMGLGKGDSFLIFWPLLVSMLDFRRVNFEMLHSAKFGTASLALKPWMGPGRRSLLAFLSFLFGALGRHFFFGGGMYVSVEDHPSYLQVVNWSMVKVSSLRIGLWDPLQCFLFFYGL